ncbi:vacuolar protein sorting-associated protein 8 homolog [Prunus yedoensis var. nudiflora]|uniref:Vacuolar protein sorting-associated protein 8 homolog n=1 Tax=Prunus yedoensis var. nudiflora TaxID=2094558 RepID=A0A314ZD39_PRUYE|nr:vacuolar protein sorting-associated protein 8 homolog [Prunus yedoensis var. nudiflora]
MELDLDSFLNSHLSLSDEDDDDNLNSVPHRTIDEILNDSDSSASSSPPSTIHRLASDPKPPHPTDAVSVSSAKSDESSQVRPRPNLYTRVKSGELSDDPVGKVSKPSPWLLGGMRTNAKPGAALAAAAAASRSMPTPHAAAIKSKRSAGSGVFQKVPESTELDDKSEVGSNSNNDTNVGSSEVAESNSNEGEVDFGDELLRKGRVWERERERELEETSQGIEVSAGNAPEEVKNDPSAPALRRDHGSPQVLAVHSNYIAIGMARGAILVIPNANSWIARNDLMRSDFYMLQSARGPALSGYADGHITVWDVQRASVAKVITGEHTAPVVHTLFLGQDSQVTRQFKAVTGDSKGLVLLHSFSVVPLLNRFSIKTQIFPVAVFKIACFELMCDVQQCNSIKLADLVDVDWNSAFLMDKERAQCCQLHPSSLMNSLEGLHNLSGKWDGYRRCGRICHPSNCSGGKTNSQFGSLCSTFKTRWGSGGCHALYCLEMYKQSRRLPANTENMPAEVVERVSLLAIAWDRKVQVAKLVKSELKVYGKWSLESAAIGVAWLDDQMLVVLTMTGQLCLFAKDGTVIHQTSFSVDGFGGDDLIAYHTHFVNIFGNPEKAYHNCVAVRGASVYVLGPMHLIVSRLLPWKERIQVLRRAGDWMGALNMAMTIYDGQAHGVVDLPRTLVAVQEAIKSYLVELLLSYVEEVFSYISVALGNQIGIMDQVDDLNSKSSSVHSEIKEQYTRVGGVAVEFCVHIKRTDILFDEIFSKFVAVQQRDTFLELLEPYILKDMLGSLPPEIMQALVEHYSRKGWLQRVEQCVLHMDISSLDFNQVVRLCREHGLYSALVYLFNKGLDDFRSPLEELLVVLQNSKKESATALGYRMLVYLKYCFSGLAFPPGQGAIPPPRLPSLRTELLQFLLEGSDAPNSRAAGGEYLNLYFLLELDTEATLDVLRCAFIEDEISKPDVSSHDSADANMELPDGNNSMAQSQNSMVQSTVDTLIHIVSKGISQTDGSPSNDETASTVEWPSKKDIGHLFEFIAYYVACGRANVSRHVLSQILEYLTSQNNFPSWVSGDTMTSKKREKQVLGLLEVVPETDWDSSYVLQLCEKARFYQVCGLIHNSRHQYLAALDCYMKDVDEPIHAFSFINKTLLQLTDNESAAFRSEVISRIPELFDLNREGTFVLVIDHFTSEEGSHILSELRSHPKSLFLYLKTVIEVHLSGTLDFSSLRKDDLVRVKDQSKAVEAYLERICDFPKLLPTACDEITMIPPQLLCQYERNSVLKFLETFDSYRVEHCLRLCQKYGITDAASFLLERVGDVGSALLLTLSTLNEKFIKLDTAVGSLVSSGSARTEHFSNALKLEEVSDINSTLHACIGLCQRNTHRLNPDESEALWFRLLDSFCEPLTDSLNAGRVSKGDDLKTVVAESLESEEDEVAFIIEWRISKLHKGAHILRKVFSRFIKEIVEGMIGYVRLPTIMSKLLSDNGSQEFGDFKFTILGMLSTYGFERRILDTAKSLIEDDTFYTMSILKKGASHGYAPRSQICCICDCLLDKNSSSYIRIFNCGHATHLQCEVLENGTSSSSSSSGCPVCMPKKKSQRSRNKSVLPEKSLVKGFSSRTQQIHGTTVHPHESNASDNTYGLHQISRFEMLTNLQRDRGLVEIENMPQLRLAPPAVYHEKVQKGTVLSPAESSSDLASIGKQSKTKQLKELKVKGSSLRFPLKSNIFGNGKEKTSKR